MMNEETAEALEGSIKKWEEVSAGRMYGGAWSSCPLCLMFYRGATIVRPVLHRCEGCPVKEKTGQVGCESTPYVRYVEEYERADNDESWDEPKYHKRVLKAACAELEFLKGLRDG